MTPTYHFSSPRLQGISAWLQCLGPDLDTFLPACCNKAGRTNTALFSVQNFCPRLLTGMAPTAASYGTRSRKAAATRGKSRLNFAPSSSKQLPDSNYFRLGPLRGTSAGSAIFTCRKLSNLGCRQWLFVQACCSCLAFLLHVASTSG